MARLLASAPGALNTPRVYSRAPATTRSAGARPATAAASEVGDVYLIHPLTMHSATMSCFPRAKSIFNVPFPFLETGVASKQGALSTVVLTIEEARHAARAPTPLLCALYAVTIAAGAARRAERRSPPETRRSRAGWRRCPPPPSTCSAAAASRRSMRSRGARSGARRREGGARRGARARRRGGRWGGVAAALWRRARDLQTLGALLTAWRRRRAPSVGGATRRGTRCRRRRCQK